MSLGKSNSSSAAVAIIDQRMEALEERIYDAQERIKELRQIREAVLRDLGTAPPLAAPGRNRTEAEC